MTSAPTPATPSNDLAAVYSQLGEARWLPSELSRGPWDPRAQHGGAPCGLLAHLAENALAGESDWQLARLGVDLLRPVPVAPLVSQCKVQPARGTARVDIELMDEVSGAVVARARALMLRRQEPGLELPAGLPGWAPAQLLPAPQDCHERLRIPGLPDVTSFHATAMDIRVAQGDATQPGPAAAWFRLAQPFLAGAETSPAMRAVTAADFGNGLSWVLPATRYLFANADITIHLHRMPQGEWVGLQSQTQCDGSGAGTTLSRLYDEQGSVGVAIQTLVLRAR